ncbi:glycosyltransferase [Loktanella salsilacus]|uniref:glycosyltransferase n=1 Tax=Loktanella salsilacus TaxID=195913 RepID=UPI0037367F32
MIKPDRIVIINDYASNQGGAGYLAGALAQGLAGRGVPVTTIVGDEGGSPAPIGADMIAFGGASLLDQSSATAAAHGIYNRRTAAQMRSWMTQHDTPRTLYHLHNWSNILSPSIFDALAPVAHRTVIHAHDYFLACPNGAYLDYSRAQVCNRDPLSLSCVMTRCDKRAHVHKLWRVARQAVLTTRLAPHLKAATFVAIHPDMHPALHRAIQPRQMVTIRNPISPFGPCAQQPERQRGIVHIGQVQRLKGVYDLANAGQALGLRIDFYGAGEDLADLQSRFACHRYHGWTDRTALAAHLQQARVVVVGSQSPEPFCLAAFEAAATGVPLVVSDAILAARELTKAGLALPFKAGNVADLTRVLGGVIRDDNLVAQLAGAARAAGPALGHGMDGWIDSHLDLYRQILQPAARQVASSDVLAPA